MAVLIELGPEKQAVVDRLAARYPHRAECMATANCHMLFLSKIPISAVDIKSDWQGRPTSWHGSAGHLTVSTSSPFTPSAALVSGPEPAVRGVGVADPRGRGTQGGYGGFQRNPVLAAGSPICGVKRPQRSPGYRHGRRSSHCRSSASTTSSCRLACAF